MIPHPLACVLVDTFHLAGMFGDELLEVIAEDDLAKVFEVAVPLVNRSARNTTRAESAGNPNTRARTRRKRDGGRFVEVSTR
jgi:hypothetical protein